MIIKCKTLEQVKKIIEVEEIKEGWEDKNINELIRKNGHICIRVYKGYGYDNEDFYRDTYPKIRLIEFKDSNYSEIEEDKIKVRIVATAGNNWYKVGEKYDVYLDKNPSYYRLNNCKTLEKRHCEILDDDGTSSINEAITLLENSGYKIIPPVITDEEVLEKIKEENDKIGYTPNWNEDVEKFSISYSHNCKKYDIYVNYETKSLGAIYTTEEIARKICKELNSRV